MHATPGEEWLRHHQRLRIPTTATKDDMSDQQSQTPTMHLAPLGTRMAIDAPA
jgi:hypothetical protein